MSNDNKPAAAQEAVTWLSKDDAQLALFQAIQAIKLGNPTDDKMILANLREAGLWIGRYAAAPVAAAQEAVAYLDIGAGGYLDLYSNLPEVQLSALPKGRHALGIIGTYGIDGYAAAPVAAAPVRPSALAASIAELDAFLGGDCVEPLTLAQSEAAALVLQEMKRLMASTPAAPGIDLAPRPMATAPRDGTMLRLLVLFDDHATEDTEGPAWTIGACNDDNVHQDEGAGWQFAGWCWDHDHFTEGKGTPVGWLPLIDASPKERAFLQTVEGLEFDAPMDAVVHESPKGAVPRSDLVPGVVRCAKCSFQLARTNLYLGSGTTGPGDSKTEPCPNGCGPLWPVTWQTWATEGWQQAERYLEELRQLQAGPKGGSTDENNDLLPELRDVEDYFTSVDPNPIHLATVRQAISVIADSPKGGSDALARAYGYLWHVNHPEDIPTGHPYMSADRAAVEARKELRDMLTHEQRGEGINCVRQKLLADMQATSAEVGA